jgi:hypothetical protein
MLGRKPLVRDIMNGRDDPPNNIAARAVGGVLEQIPYRRADLRPGVVIAREIPIDLN